MKTAIFILILTVITSSAFCKTITVTSSADNGAGTLRQAVLDAESGDSIIFNDSVSSITLSTVILLEKSITISGDMDSTTTISAPNSRHFVLPDMTGTGESVVAGLNNLTLKNGYFYTCGGSILNIKGNTLEIQNCLFINNESGEFSGALENAGTLKIYNSIFNGNRSNSRGIGAISNIGEAYINNTVFMNNHGSNVGSIYNYNGGIIILNGCLLKNNNGNYSGLANRGRALIVNCLFIGNTSNIGSISNYKLDKIDLKETSLTIINSNIVDNVGEGIYNDQTLKLYNSIVINNNAIQDINNDNNGVITSANNLIGISNTNLTGNGNIFNTDPLFVGNGDYSLQENSPAINQGDNSFFPDTILIDLSGNSRISGSSIDLGAYEYQQTPADIFNKYNSNLNIYSQGHTIYVEDALLEVKIYNVMGKLVAEGKNSVFPVSKAGIYIVLAENQTQKVMVK